MNSKPSQNLTALREQLYDHLFESIVPFWLDHGQDPDGGINTCIADDGSLVSRDKWLWSQWRAVWVFSKLYNRFGQDERYLHFAQNIFQFCIKHGWDEAAGAWRLRVGHDGAVQAGPDSIYCDGFAIYGATELAKAGSKEAGAWAVKTADSLLKRIYVPHDTIPHFPYPVPAGARVHGIPMMFSLVLWELGAFLDVSRYRDAALAMQADIFRHFYRPELDLIVERVAANNTLYPGALGTAVVPGHVIEDMWFQIHIMLESRDTARIGEACRLMRRHAEVGWDEEFGGLFLAVDAKGGNEIGWKFADTKLWWPHTEALYGFLLAYEQTRAAWCLEWFDKVHEYAFSHYPVKGHGEWTQRLDRRGGMINEVVALPVKDPFHLPRALIYCIEVLDRINGNRTAM